MTESDGSVHSAAHFSHNQEIFPLERVACTGAGSVIYPPGGVFGPRIQKDIQLVLLDSGHMEVNIAGQSQIVKPGHAALLMPGYEEFFVFSQKQETWHRWISVHFSSFRCEEEQILSNLPFCVPITSHLNRITEMILSMKAEYPEDSRLMISLGHLALQIYYAGVTSTATKPPGHSSVILVKQLIQERFGDELTLNDLAAHAGVTAEHLIRLFRKSDGTTPIRYLWNYRCIRAVELLKQTGLSISEIADRCGFKSTFHFAKSIKKQVGLTPTEIRQSSWLGGG
ncbi:helix-turn-helix domain-containing protein [Paenibacillus sp. NPDC058910]|uniref:helix-turn-helix domain-containing protein n=1 Tax=unclassified Paenibacillus TaxID=185978 RepID=UPI00368D83F9